MPKVFPEDERSRVFELAGEGVSNASIARKMKEEFPENWSSSYAERSIARLLKGGGGQTDPEEEKTLDEMTREERFKYIESRLRYTPRFRMAFKNFGDDEREVFTDEYLGIIRSVDTLTEAEEQALFAAILELILALQALSRKEKEEQFRDKSMAGEIEEDHPSFRRNVDDKYQREYDQHMKLYQKGMSELKMSRSQRLKEVRSQKMTLVDLAEELSSKNAQSEVADEIERLAKLKDDELQKLLDLGHIHGVFEEF